MIANFIPRAVELDLFKDRPDRLAHFTLCVMANNAEGLDALAATMQEETTKFPFITTTRQDITWCRLAAAFIRLESADAST
jgi:hypothetical protein